MYGHIGLHKARDEASGLMKGLGPFVVDMNKTARRTCKPCKSWTPPEAPGPATPQDLHPTLKDQLHTTPDPPTSSYSQIRDCTTPGTVGHEAGTLILANCGLPAFCGVTFAAALHAGFLSGCL